MAFNYNIIFFAKKNNYPPYYAFRIIEKVVVYIPLKDFKVEIIVRSS